MTDQLTLFDILDEPARRPKYHAIPVKDLPKYKHKMVWYLVRPDEVLDKTYARDYVTHVVDVFANRDGWVNVMLADGSTHLFNPKCPNTHLYEV